MREQRSSPAAVVADATWRFEDNELEAVWSILHQNNPCPNPPSPPYSPSKRHIEFQEIMVNANARHADGAEPRGEQTNCSGKTNCSWRAHARPVTRRTCAAAASKCIPEFRPWELGGEHDSMVKRASPRAGRRRDAELMRQKGALLSTSELVFRCSAD